ncbi:MAG: glycosyltransferase [Candidatus Neomarinimicrobiota bacterium]
MTNLIEFSTILAFLYLLIMLLIALGLIFIRMTRRIRQTPSVSVIVCARNEAPVISRLLQSLANLRYPEDKYEVILIDDDSSDGTQNVMNYYAAGKENWKVLRHDKSTDPLKGKKGAITQGVRESRGEIIMVTDADCVVPPDWIASMVACFRPGVGMVLGHSPIEVREGFMNIYERFDTLCEASVAAASTYYNKPTHANGRNLAYRKQAFDDVGGYNSGANTDTGDDFFLMQKIRTQTRWRFAYNTDPASFVLTEPMTFGKKYIHQQLRRNSKAFNLTIPFFLLGMIVFFFHVVLAILVFSPSLWNWLGILLIFKFLSEFIATYHGARLFGQADLLKYFPVLWAIYPVCYLTSQLVGSLKLYRWK